MQERGVRSSIRYTRYKAEAEARSHKATKRVTELENRQQGTRREAILYKKLIPPLALIFGLLYTLFELQLPVIYSESHYLQNISYMAKKKPTDYQMKSKHHT
jgi:hypothetical protein